MSHTRCHKVSVFAIGKFDIVYPQTRWHAEVEVLLGSHPVVEVAGTEAVLAETHTFVVVDEVVDVVAAGRMQQEMVQPRNGKMMERN